MIKIRKLSLPSTRGLGLTSFARSCDLSYCSLVEDIASKENSNLCSSP